jgi:hypothetical protein
MSKAIALVAVVAAAATASGCGTIQRAVGAVKTSPDEFRVVTQAPLTLPPDYSLRPPRPGDPRPSELEPDAEARAALFGDEGQGIVRRDQGFVDRLLAFGGQDAAPSTPLDPEAEAQRLQTDEAIRRATGGGDVVIERGRSGFKLPGT